jgi:hypothetical protein
MLWEGIGPRKGKNDAQNDENATVAAKVAQPFHG